MPPTLSQPLLSISLLRDEWRSLGRSPAAVDALARLAARDRVIGGLVRGVDGAPPTCSSPQDLVTYMHAAQGRPRREEAAQVVRGLLREQPVHPLVSRTLIQALLPGMLMVAKRLGWGAGGDWCDAEEFFSDVLSTTWATVHDWSGQDRPYAVLDLLSAIRCRLRRQLLSSKEDRRRNLALTGGTKARLVVRAETDLEELTRMLIDLRGRGMRSEDAQVLYAHHVLGYSISELAAVVGRERRSLYARRDRGQQQLCA